MRVPRTPAAVVGAAVTALALSACGGGSSPAASPTVTVTTSTSASQPVGSTSPVAATSPAIVAVTRHGALVVLNAATGSVSQTLVASGVEGDEVSVSGSGMVYFARKTGCKSEIQSVPVTGGSVADIAAGSLPAVTADGSKLAFASQPMLTTGCVPTQGNLSGLYKVEVRALSSGTTVVYPAVPVSQQSGLPYPISHLSWAPDGAHLAVSVASAEDNEGWNLVLMDTAQAQYYLDGAGTASVQATGSPDPQRSYLREGIYLPDGDLFVSRACCAGEPAQNISRLMWEVSTGGTLVHQVAVGFASLDHISLAASPDGSWLLYLAGKALYVSHAGNKPAELATGFIAATFA
jgi:hypothetical protein